MLVHGYWTGKYPQFAGAKISALTVFVFVVSMLLLDALGPGLPHRGRVLLAIPRHNPTYNFARGFAILAFLSFLKLTDPEKPQAGDDCCWLAFDPGHGGDVVGLEQSLHS